MEGSKSNERKVDKKKEKKEIDSKTQKSKLGECLMYGKGETRKL